MKSKQSIYKMALQTLVAAAALIAAGCKSPNLFLGTGSTRTVSGSEPTVNQLVDHLACEIGRTYNENAGIPTGEESPSSAKLRRDPPSEEHQRRWKRLVENNFVAAIDLTLMVTRTEGVNPSVSYIWPLDGAGHSISPISYSGTPTPTTFNTTLALGFQLNSTADRNVEQDFLVDMRSLVAQYNFTDEHLQYPESDDDAKARAQDAYNRRINRATEPSAFPYCLPRGAVTASTAISQVPLRGNMALFEMIEDGLSSLDRSSAYNLYGTSGPTHLVDAIAHGIVVTAAGAPSGGASAGTSAGKTSFGSKVDFFITSGVNGGPSLSLLNWKAGAGGGGSGGGSASSGGGAAAGAGGGSGGQLGNYSRMTQDSLTVTFGATCAAPETENDRGASIFIPAEMAVKATPVYPSKTLTKGKDTFQTPVDVTKLGWQTGMKLSGAGFAPGTKIKTISVDADGSLLTLNSAVVDDLKGPITVVVPAIKVAWEAGTGDLVAHTERRWVHVLTTTRRFWVLRGIQLQSSRSSLFRLPPSETARRKQALMYQLFKELLIRKIFPQSNSRNRWRAPTGKWECPSVERTF
jgi:hypothetical protein